MYKVSVSSTQNLYRIASQAAMKSKNDLMLSSPGNVFEGGDVFLLSSTSLNVRKVARVKSSLKKIVAAFLSIITIRDV